MAIFGKEGDRGRERRRYVRVRISLEARLEAPPRAPIPCEVYNISIGGALIACNMDLCLNQPVVLHAEGFGALKAHVARVTSTVLALAFEEVDQDAFAIFIESRRQGAEDGTPTPVLPIG